MQYARTHLWFNSLSPFLLPSLTTMGCIYVTPLLAPELWLCTCVGVCACEYVRAHTYPGGPHEGWVAILEGSWPWYKG